MKNAYGITLTAKVILGLTLLLGVAPSNAWIAGFITRSSWQMVYSDTRDKTGETVQKIAYFTSKEKCEARITPYYKRKAKRIRKEIVVLCIRTDYGNYLARKAEKGRKATKRL